MNITVHMIAAILAFDFALFGIALLIIAKNERRKRRALAKLRLNDALNARNTPEPLSMVEIQRLHRNRWDGDSCVR